MVIAQPIAGLFEQLPFDQCQLLGNFFGYLIQMLLGFLASLALVVKFFCEKPRRPVKIWMFDSSKQLFGAILGHCFNILFSSLLTSDSDQSPCVYYMGNFLIDSIVGALLTVAILKLVEWMSERNKYSPLAQTGFYGAEPSFHIWAIQMGAWVFITCMVKLITMYAFIIPFKNALYQVGEEALWFIDGGNAQMELVVVMVIIPVIVNAIVFLLIDVFLKGIVEPPKKVALSEDEDPLLPDMDFLDPSSPYVDPLHPQEEKDSSLPEPVII